ncbi:MAG: ferredoxin, partial [Eubacterium sp.]|nr:ferredoxin [Eubacterium sp.]
YPTVKDKVSTTVSPMVASARFIKQTHPNAKIVFVGPCIAKKNEVKSRYPKEIDYCLTFDEMAAMIYTKEIDFAKYEPEDEVASYYGKAFAKSGGVAAAVVKVCKEKGVEPPAAVLCNGVDECKKNLTMLKINRFQGDLLEGMVCDGGCINGPGKAKPLMELKRDYEKLLKATANTEVIKTCDDTGISTVNMHRPGTHHDHA